MDCDTWLENWCKKKGIDAEKIPDKIWDLVVSRTEDDAEEYLREHEHEIVNEWAWLEIEQHLNEHPEWKIKQDAKGDK